MDEFVAHWQFVRSETLEILGSLRDEQLSFRPEGKKWQPLGYQFGCMGRTQLVYAKAAETGSMDFAYFASPELPSKTAYSTVAALLDFLNSANEVWLASVKANTGGVIWPEGKKSLSLHIASLAEHERLHHGQLISYFTLAGLALPSGFKANWAL